jgi:long-subunit fatty acid transport protein
LLGLVYRSEADADPEGDRRWRGLRPGVVARLPSEIELGSTNPPGLEAGLRLRASDRARLFFNLGWQDWSRFSNNLLAFGNDRS